MAIGIMGAMLEEVESLVGLLEDTQTAQLGSRVFHSGLLFGKPAVVSFSRWGKVASAVTAAHLLATYRVDHLIFTGVAGAAAPSLGVGDVVVGDRLVQHDMDASPLFPRHEIPLTGVTFFEADPEISNGLARAAENFLANGINATITPGLRREFKIDKPHLERGLIASGDKFFSGVAELDELKNRLPEVRCVEMEGAAVAQVCAEHGVPFGIVRTISDSADDNAHVDFPRFIGNVANLYAAEILKHFLT